MMIYDQPNYAEAQKLAYETIQNSAQKELPVSIKKLIRTFPKLHLQKYSVFAKQRKLSFEEVLLFTNSEEGCLWMRSDGTYLILYNDYIKNSGRIRFTLAHELGHYIMKHNEKSGKTILPRYSLSDDEHDLFEKEANYFAKRLLAPIPLVDLYVANWKKIKANCIEFAFDTSHTLASYVIKDLNKRRQNANIIREGHPMVDYFIDFINYDASSQICKTCSTVQSSKNNFCKTCGSNNLIESSAENYTNYYIMKGTKMDYTKIETNANGTPVKCPKCEYESLNDEFIYCPICSTHIHNVCLGPEWNKITETIDGDIELSIQERNDHNSSCKGNLEGDFRYCPHCGNETSYGYQKILTSWSVEKNNFDSTNFSFQEPKFNDLPF
ncbi:hypothetical protein A5819_003435 [Enterococcus sp. 7E2_DIV0204]|uniref:ImmA/IrrE family metallo-endopeptidase n=1 Tax=unclassified Enterococcus TaxID=2608891 RepID=UPI000B6DF785|nr:MULTISPECIES: ImmA/IrrE family metallo-endopeptidase [unclassified Enterococcus]OTN86585.1 hypothetical protein A5819_003435 [Enterococcus sp. 7E2_DIV0204]OTP47626.1 hypothetical protein A5884_003381 [Enterococcus sp. 7D2_DIV0200]